MNLNYITLVLAKSSNRWQRRPHGCQVPRLLNASTKRLFLPFFLFHSQRDIWFWQVLLLYVDALSMDVLTLPSLDDAKHVEVVRVNNHFHASRESAARGGG